MQTLQRPDEVAREVELPPVESVERRTREGVVIVVPALAKRQQADDPLIAAAVRRLEFSLTKRVTDRVDAPGDVMRQEHAHQATPEQPGQGERPSTHEPADGKWNRERYCRPQQEGFADEGHDAVI